MKKNDKRHNKLADRHFQFKYLLQILILEVFVCFITILMTIGFHFFILNTQFLSSNYWLWTLLASFFIFLACSSFIYNQGVYLSLRIAGPLVKLKKSMELLLSGNTNQQIGFRKEDEWHELAILFNKLTRKIDEDMEYHQDNLVQIVNHVEALEQVVKQLPKMEQKERILARLKAIEAICLQNENHDE